MALNNVRSGLRGGIAFLTRLPVESTERDWRRFQVFPAAFPIVGYLVGSLVALPFFVVDGPVAAFGYLFALVAVVGIAHLDGVADLGDAAAVHDTDDRRSVLKDTTIGVGGTAGIAVVVAGLALAGLALGAMGELAAAGLVVAAEVGAKLGMATVACFGRASHEGLGSQFTRNAGPSLLLGPALASIPAVLLAAYLTGNPVAGTVAVLAGPLVAFAVIAWAERTLGGVNGDVFGAVNELGRLVALHAGVVAWTAL